MIANNRAQLVKYCLRNKVQVLNFHYCGWDGHLKTLNFVIRDRKHLENILEAGERVDGSSLFPFIKAGKSDLYVIPRYATAFRNPFEDVPTVDVLCEFFTRDGEPYMDAPRYILHKASEAFTAATGLRMQAMGELEYYIVAPEEELFTIPDQKGYHESAPFCKYADLRVEAMRLITACGGKVKYGHSEVGNFTENGRIYEQNEIEFQPVEIEDAADQLVIAKWVMWQLAYRYGVDLTFAPKITDGKAGSGLHVHCKFTRNGKPVMTSAGELTEECRKAIAGMMDLGTSLPAFGNPSPVSFRRLVPNQEAPTSLCWSFSNRSALVRVPLGWTSETDMAAICNKDEKARKCNFSDKQTFEWRASDGTADIYLLMASLCVAARHGFELDAALDLADKTFVGLGVNIHDASNAALKDSLKQLPANCAAAAGELSKFREVYEKAGVFSPEVVDYQIGMLKSIG